MEVSYSKQIIPIFFAVLIVRTVLNRPKVAPGKAQDLAPIDKAAAVQHLREAIRNVINKFGFLFVLVVFLRVPPHEVHVVLPRRGVVVFVLFELLLDRAEIHRLGNALVVIWRVVCVRVHREQERNGERVPHEFVREGLAEFELNTRKALHGLIIVMILKSDV